MVFYLVFFRRIGFIIGISVSCRRKWFVGYGLLSRNKKYDDSWSVCVDWLRILGGGVERLGYTLNCDISTVYEKLLCIKYFS